jgi:hypothetical protein
MELIGKSKVETLQRGFKQRLPIHVNAYDNPERDYNFYDPL